MVKNNSKLRNISTNTRATIIDLLILCNDGAYSNEIVPSRLSNSSFEAQDRAMITNVVYSTLRNQIRIDNALSKISKRPLEKLDAIVLNALRSVTSQIMLGFDAHGVVNETVTVMPFAFKSFVNALSRKIVNEMTSGKFFKDESLSVENSVPEWVAIEMQNVFGEEAEKYLPLFNKAPSVTLFQFDENNIEASGIIARSTPGDIVNTAQVLESAGDISELEIIRNGKAIVVDQGSQLIVKSIPINENDIVLDLCSAPGGKSFMMSTRAKHVVSNDVSFSRMKKFLDTKSRTGTKNVSGIVSDGTKSVFQKETFDVVLVDAPCSGLGVLRRRPDARNTIDEKIVDELFALQKEIIKSSIPLVKSGGIYAYSVCTFSNKETVEIDNWIKEEFPELESIEVKNLPEAIISKSRGYLLKPGINNDSMYFLVLKKTV